MTKDEERRAKAIELATVYHAQRLARFLMDDDTFLETAEQFYRFLRKR